MNWLSFNNLAVFVAPQPSDYGVVYFTQCTDEPALKGESVVSSPDIRRREIIKIKDLISYLFSDKSAFFRKKEPPNPILLFTKSSLV